jgi:hypothetical protein
VKRLYSETVFSKESFEKLLKNIDLTRDEVTKLRVSGMFGAYKAKGLGPPVSYIVTDDAPNLAFWNNHQLCWVHEIRKYKLLDLFGHTDLINEVLDEIRLLYQELRRYRLSPTSYKKAELESEFNRLFNQKTELASLNVQLELTNKKKTKLLFVLDHPEVEIHNNLAERDIREKVIKRKISLFNRSLGGVESWDLMLSLASTCRKNGISFFKYLIDRHNQKGEIPYLGQIIQHY